jgi:FkbM family methyltransferase
MRDFLIRRLRRAPVIAELWNEHERMRADRDAALAVRDAALAERDAALTALVAQNDGGQSIDPTSDPYPAALYTLWAYRLLLGREPEHPQAVNSHPRTSRRDVVQRFVTSQEFLIRNSLDNAPVTPLRYMVELEPDMRFWLLASDRFISPAIATGMYEPVETTFINRQVRPGTAALDIGANLGWFTVHLARIVGADGRVDAFEPRVDLFNLLTRTVAESKIGNVTLHNCALAAENSSGQMVWSPHDVNPGGTYLVAAEFADSTAKSQAVDVKTLDACISHPVDFIKIDVEGAELLVFRGAERILSKDRPTILVEINRPNLARTSHSTVADFGDFAAKFKYRLYEITEDGGCGRQVSPAGLLDIQLINVAMVPDDCAA